MVANMLIYNYSYILDQNYYTMHRLYPGFRFPFRISSYLINLSYASSPCNDVSSDPFWNIRTALNHIVYSVRIRHGSRYAPHLPEHFRRDRM